MVQLISVSLPGAALLLLHASRALAFTPREFLHRGHGDFSKRDNSTLSCNADEYVCEGACIKNYQTCCYGTESFCVEADSYCLPAPYDAYCCKNGNALEQCVAEQGGSDLLSSYGLTATPKPTASTAASATATTTGHSSSATDCDCDDEEAASKDDDDDDDDEKEDDEDDDDDDDDDEKKDKSATATSNAPSLPVFTGLAVRARDFAQGSLGAAVMVLAGVVALL